jgi:hypothetical protein
LSQKKTEKKAILEFYEQFACVGGDLVFFKSLCGIIKKKFNKNVNWEELVGEL